MEINFFFLKIFTQSLHEGFFLFLNFIVFMMFQEPSDGPSKEVPLHQPVSELESPASSKDVEQPSPVSILEAPFVDDLSCGSEYFESVSADLHGKLKIY